MKVFLMPFAGGTSMFFSQWIDDEIKYYAFDYSGHGRRMGEKLMNSLQEVSSDICENVIRLSEDCDYALFGHSLGGLVVYEMYRQIKKAGYKLPKHLFISGTRPPHIKPRKRISTLNGDEYKEAVFKLGGINEEFFENRTIFNAFNPILKNDLKINEEYQVEDKVQIDCCVTIFNGVRDETVNNKEKLAWKYYCRNGCNFKQYDGDHFFINHYSNEIIDEIRKTLIC